MKRSLTPELIEEIVEAATAVADDFLHLDDPDYPRIDRSFCAYNRRGLLGADPQGTCSFGCVDEPSCHTDGPWPMDRLLIAVSEAGLLDNNTEEAMNG